MVVTTGSTVLGTVTGLKDHLGGGIGIMYVVGNPDGIVNPAQPTACPSGTAIAYDTAGNQLYQSVTGSTWQKLGSVA